MLSKRKSPEGNSDCGSKKARSEQSSMSGNEEIAIDEDLHSRQLAVYGRETMRRLAGAHILISGMKGLGVEVAKNVILAGVKAVTVHDTEKVEKTDLAAQFYLTDDDIGKNRAEACLARLQELNTHVEVSSSTAAISESFLSQFQAVALTESSLAESFKVDDFCHANNIPFVKSEIRGVFGTVFCDFGAKFTVSDVDGEQPHKGIVASISNGSPALVTCVDDERLEFQDGQLVTFSEIKGMGELNGADKQVKVKNVKAHSFEIDMDTSSFGAYDRGGLVVQVKEPRDLKFKTLREAMIDPGEFLLTDFAKFDRSGMLHLAFQALDQFKVEHGHFPRPAHASDENYLVALCKTIDERSKQKCDNVDEAILRKFAQCCSGELSPMAAMFGGIVGQELVKACSGKFHPLHQFLYFDSVESLPKDVLPADEYAPTGSRYDAQIAVIGKTMHEKLSKLQVFLVGAGALGCEFIKNLALMGVASGGGKITLTDDDIIEKSNLSRQFLFRDWDVKSNKSTAAANAAQKINPDININVHHDRVSPDTENVFDDAFWQGLDVVVNALDNVNARLYVDSRCVYFQKPLMESGTLGTKCNTQCVIPHMTENYGASRDPPEKQAPMCTLHSFPFIIDHCLAWARSEFEGLLEKTPTEANKFLANPTQYCDDAKQAGDSTARESLEKVVDLLVTSKASTYEGCVNWARLLFQDYFYNRISQLTYTFPEDAVTSTGNPFWSAPKRFPTAIEFKTDDPSHMMFIRAGANLKAEVHGIKQPGWSDEQLAACLSSLTIEPFTPKQGVKIETDPKATSTAATAFDDDGAIAGLSDKLLSTSPSADCKLSPIEFEKDDDTNFHMDFISALANMRARNYQIPEVDKLQAKLIAGRIIPAIATTTAMATGMVCLELYKLFNKDHKVEDFRNTFANLAIPLFAMAEPVPPKMFKYNELEWSLWDRWILEGDLTVQELLDWCEERKLTAYSISCGQSLIYNNFMPKHKERLQKKLSALVQDIAKLAIPNTRQHFDIVVACEDEEGEDIDVPLVSIKFR